MTVAASTRTARSSAITRARSTEDRADTWHARLATICAVSLMLGAGVHLNVGATHVGSNFGTLSLLAAVAQFGLGISLYLRRTTLVVNAVLVLSLVLVQLYLLNVTVGLPPVIAHSHGGGEHVVLGYVFADPGVVDLQGASAVFTELLAVASGAALLRMRPS